MSRIGSVARKGRSLENVWIAERSLWGWISSELKIPRPDAKIKRPRYTKEEPDPIEDDDIKKIVKACEYTRDA